MKHRNVYLLLVASTFFWGANFNLGKFLMESMSPLAAAAWRFSAAALLMAAYLLSTEGADWRGIRNNIVPLVGMALIGIFGFNVSFFYGLQTTSSVNGSLIMTLNPTFTVILAALVIGDKITWRQALGLLLSIVGVTVVTTGGSWQALAQLHFVLGDGYLLFGNLCWAAYAVIGKRAVKGLTPIQVTTVTTVIGAAAITGLALLRDTGVARVPSAGSLLALAVMAVFGTLLAYLWWNQGIKTIGPGKTSVFFDLVPIFTMVIAVSLGERVVAAQLVGALFVIAGVILSSGIMPGLFARIPQASAPAK